MKAVRKFSQFSLSLFTFNFNSRNRNSESYTKRLIILMFSSLTKCAELVTLLFIAQDYVRLFSKYLSAVCFLYAEFKNNSFDIAFSIRILKDTKLDEKRVMQEESLSKRYDRVGPSLSSKTNYIENNMSSTN